LPFVPLLPEDALPGVALLLLLGIALLLTPLVSQLVAIVPPATKHISAGNVMQASLTWQKTLPSLCLAEELLWSFSSGGGGISMLEVQENVNAKASTMLAASVMDRLTLPLL
jgi:hypothetical protein